MQRRKGGLTLSHPQWAASVAPLAGLPTPYAPFWPSLSFFCRKVDTRLSSQASHISFFFLFSLRSFLLCSQICLSCLTAIFSLSSLSSRSSQASYCQPVRPAHSSLFSSFALLSVESRFYPSLSFQAAPSFTPLAVFRFFFKYSICFSLVLPAIHAASSPLPTGKRINQSAFLLCSLSTLSALFSLATLSFSPSWQPVVRLVFLHTGPSFSTFGC